MKVNSGHTKSEISLITFKYFSSGRSFRGVTSYLCPALDLVYHKFIVIADVFIIGTKRQCYKIKITRLSNVPARRAMWKKKKPTNARKE